ARLAPRADTLVLDSEEVRGQLLLGARGRRAAEPEGRGGLVHGPVCRGPPAGLGHAAAVPKAGGAVVPLACVDLHHGSGRILTAPTGTGDISETPGKEGRGRRATQRYGSQT